MVVERGPSSGDAGIESGLFEWVHCTMLFGDAEQVLDALVREFRAAVPAPRPPDTGGMGTDVRDVRTSVRTGVDGLLRG